MSPPLPRVSRPAGPERRETEVALRRVLVALGDHELALHLRHALQLDGCETASLEGMPLAVQLAAFRPHLLVVDLHHLAPQLPEGLLALRETTRGALPILVLSTRPEDAGHLPGFRLGVDEFVLRAASVPELHARIDGMLRRAVGAAHPPPPADEIVRFGDTEVNLATRTVLRHGVEVELRLKEYELLLALIRRRGRVVSRQELLGEVWDYGGDVVSRTVDTHIAALRKKLEDDPVAPRYLLTVRKVGYRLRL